MTPNTELFLSYVDRFQMRTDANGNPGNFTKVFNTNRGVYERTLNDGAYTLLLTNKTIKNLTTNIQTTMIYTNPNQKEVQKAYLNAIK